MSEQALLEYVKLLEERLRIWESLAQYKDINMIEGQLAAQEPKLRAARQAVGR